MQPQTPERATQNPDRSPPCLRSSSPNSGDEAAADEIRARHHTFYDPDLVDRPDDLAEAVVSARVLIVRNPTKVTEALIARAPNLSCVDRLVSRTPHIAGVTAESNVRVSAVPAENVLKHLEALR